VSEGLAQPDWMQPAPNVQASYVSDFRCAIADRALIEVSGTEAGTFLHAQLSSDICNAGIGDVILTSYSDPAGRLLTLMRVVVTETGYLLELPKDRSEAVLARLRRYVLRTDVRFEDVSAAHAAFGAVGEEAVRCVAEALSDMPPPTGQSTRLEGGARLMPGPAPRATWIVLGPIESVRAAWNAFGSLSMAPPTWWELLEIESGIPSVRAATAGRFVAQMVNLDRLGAVDFRKGCYPGQEVIARTHYLGRVKRRMYPLRADTTTVPTPGDPVHPADHDSPCGEIVRAAAHPEGGIAALTVLRIDALHGDLVLADGTPVSLMPLPYPLDEAA